MEVTVKRDGLTLRGTLLKPEGVEKCPITIIFHGLMSDRANKRESMHSLLAEKLLKRGVASVRFDFNGHGESDGDFQDMTVLGEILDACKIMEYVLSLDWVTEIYIMGHSQGGLVGGMTAGYFRDKVKKLAMLAPAATIKDDSLAGNCFGTFYNVDEAPEYIPMVNDQGVNYKLGQAYMRTSRTLPVYETTMMFRGKTLIIHGSKDEAVSVFGGRRYAGYMQNVKLHVIEGDNHGLDTFSLDDVIEEVADSLTEE